MKRLLPVLMVFGVFLGSAVPEKAYAFMDLGFIWDSIQESIKTAEKRYQRVSVPFPMTPPAISFSSVTMTMPTFRYTIGCHAQLPASLISCHRLTSGKENIYHVF